MNKNIICPLDWDTNYFKIECGRVVINNRDTNINRLSEELEDYDFVSIQNVGNDVGVNKDIAYYTNAFLADLNVQFEKKISNDEKIELVESEFTIVKASDVTEEMCDKMKVEEDDFIYSKFVCDPELKNRQGYLVYKEWLKNACKADNKYFILLLSGDDIGAYILFNINQAENFGTIELVKVNHEFKGKHIATRMINGIEVYMHKHKIDYLRVGTQFNNIPAINLYHSLNFKEISRTSVFHYWKPVNKED